MVGTWSGDVSFTVADPRRQLEAHLTLTLGEPDPEKGGPADLVIVNLTETDSVHAVGAVLYRAAGTWKERDGDLIFLWDADTDGHREYVQVLSVWWLDDALVIVSPSLRRVLRRQPQ